MSNSNNTERLDPATFNDGVIIIKKNVGTKGDFKIVVNATLSAMESMKVKDGTVFNVRATG